MAEPVPPKIPEGYVALSPKSGVFSVPGSVLNKTRVVHTGNGWDEMLDSDIELDMRGDSRLDELCEYANKIGIRYTHEKSQYYEPDLRKREQLISERIIAKIHEVYGTYSNETLQNG